MASPQRGGKLLWKSPESKRSSIETWRGDSTYLSTSYAAERGRRTSRPGKGGAEAGKTSPLRRKSQVEAESGDALRGKHGSAQKQKQRKNEEDGSSLHNRGARAGLFPAPQSARTILRVPLSARGSGAAGKKEEPGSLTSRTHSNFVDRILSVRKQRQSQATSEGVPDVSRSLVKDLPRLNLSSLNPLQGAANTYRGNGNKGAGVGRYGNESAKESARTAKLISAYGEVKGQANKSRVVVNEEESDSSSEGTSSGPSDSESASERKGTARATTERRPSTTKGPVKGKDADVAKALGAMGTQNRALESARGKKHREHDGSTHSGGADVSERKGPLVKWPPQEMTSLAVAGLREAPEGAEMKSRTEDGVKEEKSGASLRSSKERLKALGGSEQGSPSGSVSERNGSDGGTPRRKTAGLGGGSEHSTPKKSAVGGLQEGSSGGGEAPRKSMKESLESEARARGVTTNGGNEAFSPREKPEGDDAANDAKMRSIAANLALNLGFGSNPTDMAQTSRVHQPTRKENEPLCLTARPLSSKPIGDWSPEKKKATKTPPPKPAPSASMTPASVLKNFADSLVDYEQSEILQYSAVFFFGPDADKVQASATPGACNYGYDDDRGDYHVRERDHLAYRFEVQSVLGKGSFGQVLKCADHKCGGCIRAVKIIRNKKRFHHQALVEVKILNFLKQKQEEAGEECNVVVMHDSFYFRGHLCISFELHSLSLYDFLKNNNFQGLSLGLIRRFATQILACLKLLRRVKIVHCDLKPENILLRSANKSAIKVIDFGSSCFEHERIYTYIQSRFYRSPEVILGIPYDMAIDMWSFGCILAELYTGYPLFPGENEAEQLACIMEVLGVPPKSVLDCSARKKMFFDSANNPRIVANSWGKKRRPATKDLAAAVRCADAPFVAFLRECFKWDARERWSPEEALQHPWIQEEKPPPQPQSARTRASSAHSHRQPSPRGIPSPVVKRLDMSLVNQAKILDLTVPDRKLSARGARKPLGSQPGITDAKAVLPPIAADESASTGARSSWRKRVV